MKVTGLHLWSVDFGYYESLCITTRSYRASEAVKKAVKVIKTNYSGLPGRTGLRVKEVKHLGTIDA